MGAAESALDELAGTCYSLEAELAKSRKLPRRDCCNNPQVREEGDIIASWDFTKDKEVEDVHTCGELYWHELQDPPSPAAYARQPAPRRLGNLIPDAREDFEVESERVSLVHKRSEQPSDDLLCLHSATASLFRGTTPEAWRAQLLTHGAKVLVDDEFSHLGVDLELGCLEVREREALYPLAELRTCDELPRPADASPTSGTFGLVVDFADLDSLVLQFGTADQRAAFQAALDLLAADARRERLPATASRDAGAAAP